MVEDTKEVAKPKKKEAIEKEEYAYVAQKELEEKVMKALRNRRKVGFFLEGAKLANYPIPVWLTMDSEGLPLNLNCDASSVLGNTPTKFSHCQSRTNEIRSSGEGYKEVTYEWTEREESSEDKRGCA